MLPAVESFAQQQRSLFGTAPLERQVGNLQGHLSVARVLALCAYKHRLGFVQPPGIHQTSRYREIHIGLAQLEVLAAIALLTLGQLAAQGLGLAQDRLQVVGVNARLHMQQSQFHSLRKQGSNLVSADVSSFQDGERFVEQAQS